MDGHGVPRVKVTVIFFAGSSLLIGREASQRSRMWILEWSCVNSQCCSDVSTLAFSPHVERYGETKLLASEWPLCICKNDLFLVSDSNTVKVGEG